MFEIHNETVVDLLSKSNKGLTIREKPKSGPYIVDLTVSVVQSECVNFKV